MVGSTPVSIQCLETISEIYFDLYWLWSMEESYKTPANEWATCLATGLINWRMKVLCGWLSQNQGCKPMRLRSLSIFHASYSSCSHWRKPTSIVCVQGRKRRWFDFFLESRSSHRLAFYSLRTIFDPWALQRSWFNSIHFEASSSKVKIDNGFSIRCGTDGQSAGVSPVKNSGWRWQLEHPMYISLLIYARWKIDQNVLTYEDYQLWQKWVHLLIALPIRYSENPVCGYVPSLDDIARSTRTSSSSSPSVRPCSRSPSLWVMNSTPIIPMWQW